METRNGEALSPVLSAIGEAFNRMPDDERAWVAANSILKFSRRIADQVGDIKLGTCLPALDYHAYWAGEWEIRNSDLVTWSYCKMWVHRSPAETMATQIVAPISKALSLKRLMQAYLRYQKSGATKEHCSLLAHMGWEMDMSRGDWVSLYVQGKRPFGNSGAYTDIYGHAGWPMDWGDDGPSEDQIERAWNLFDELVFAAPGVAILARDAMTTGKCV